MRALAFVKATRRNRMPSLQSIWGLTLLWTCVGGLIVPEELPSILSVIYSNIPPIKKGTDSRVGVGFRLGEHADFQVLLELGPQTETAPIGPNDGDSKRRRQAVRPIAYTQTYPSQVEDTIADTPGGKWLSSWRSSLINTKKTKPEKSHSLGHQKLQSMLQNDQIVSHLSQLYKNIETTTENIISETITTTPKFNNIDLPQQKKTVINNTALDDIFVKKEKTSTEN